MTQLESLIAARLRESGELKRRVAVEQAENIGRAGRAMADALGRGGKLLLFGNGGSAADAQHIAAEFVGRFARDRAPLPAVSLATDTSALTAIGNDYGFEQVFARQIRALGRPGDVAVAISTSGRSPNVIAGVEAAHERGLGTIGLTGGSGGRLAGIVDIPVAVPSACAARIQECHITVGHVLCEIVESLLPQVASTREMIRAIENIHPATPVPLRERWKKEGKTVVWTNGCFDLLHVGHVRSLEAARRMGDVLIVGVNSDDSVRRIKGPGRPIVPAAERAEILAALSCVDHVVVFDETTPEEAISRWKPDVHCKGADYAPPDGKPIPEAEVIEAYDGRIEFLPLSGSISTSDIIQRIRQRG